MVQLRYRYRWYHGSISLVVCVVLLMGGCLGKPLFVVYDTHCATTDFVFHSKQRSMENRLERIHMFFGDDVTFCHEVIHMAGSGEGRAALRACLTRKPILGDCASSEIIEEELIAHGG